MAEARHRMSIAKHKWEDNPGYSAKKDAVHALRYLSFAAQIANAGKVHVKQIVRRNSFFSSFSFLFLFRFFFPSLQIYDYTAANGYFKKIMEEDVPDWKYFDDQRLMLVEQYKSTQKCHYFHSKLETYIQEIKHTLAKRQQLFDSLPSDEEIATLSSLIFPKVFFNTSTTHALCYH